MPKKPDQKQTSMWFSKDLYWKAKMRADSQYMKFSAYITSLIEKDLADKLLFDGKEESA